MTDLELYSRKEVSDFLEKLSLERKSQFDAIEQQMCDENFTQMLSNISIRIERQQNREFSLYLTNITVLFLLGLGWFNWLVDSLFVT